MKISKILNSKKVKLLVLMSLVLTLTLGVYLYRGREVNIEVDGNKIETVSYSKTVEELIEKEELEFKEGAFINQSLDNKIEDNLDIIIINPKIYLIREKDDIKRVSSIYETVEQVLKDQEVTLGELDYTSPEPAERIEANDTINLFRVNEEVVVTTSKIAFEKIKIDDKDRFIGELKLKQKGVEGELTTHTNKRYVNGELEKSTVIKEEVTKEKKDHMYFSGTKVKPKPKPVVKAKPKAKVKTEQKATVKNTKSGNTKTTSKKSQTTKTPAKKSSEPNRGGGSISGKTITMEATAYTDDVASQGKWVGQTATGMKPQVGVVAVDPRVIPLGTKLYIEGYGNAVAGDTGGAIKGNRIDLFFNTKGEVYNFGRRQVKVTILK